ncbi:glycosyltransferase family 9 protein [Leucobacter muris]|uniref:Glycosyltransferase family 9 protein n=1 Tax=Leucobacter muris TaxID=1935379 RepID=A0ABX5QGJ3_9MICO|nr:glycosyltransferase family 9 protein [Leucobacter muris]QAB18123.1 glycosyltransferase family 9 protein [Leucobacter muris]
MRWRLGEGARPRTAPAAVAPLGSRLEGVRRIAVLRAGGLGDLLFALPAIRALAVAYPDAEVTLLGTRLAAELLQRRGGAPHRVVQLPRVPGVGADPDERVDDRAIASFLAQQRAEGYDLAAQMHGGGRFSNPFLLELGARCTIGARTPDAAPLDRGIDYVAAQHEVMRWLEVAGLVGAPPVELEPEVGVSEIERELGLAFRGQADRPLVAMHPGATDPRRRWPIESFAELAAALACDGVRVVLLGSADDERRLCGHIVDALGLEASVAGLVEDASGRLPMPELVGLLSAADVMVGNDSGPRHLAQAVGTRTASVFWCGNMLSAGPLGRQHHRAQISWTTRCPVCGADCTPERVAEWRCEHDVSFVGDVPVDAVLADVRDLLGPAPGAARRGPGR